MGDSQDGPEEHRGWHDSLMSGMHSVTMGSRGRLVIPSEVRKRAGLTEGQPLILIEFEGGVVVLTREQLKDRVRAQLRGESLVDDLLSDRRAAADADLDAGLDRVAE